MHFKGCKKLIGHKRLSQHLFHIHEIYKKYITQLLKILTDTIMLPNWLFIMPNITKESQCIWVKESGTQFTTCEIKLNSTKGVMEAVSLSGGKNHLMRPSLTSSCFSCVFVFTMLENCKGQAQSFWVLSFLFKPY